MSDKTEGLKEDEGAGPRRYLTTGSGRDGYPCPKDGAVLTLITGGAWCPACHTVWREADEISLKDLDELPTKGDGDVRS